MPPIRATVPLLSLPLLAATPALAAAPATTPAAAFHYAVALAPARAVRLDNVIGALEASPSDDGKLDVRAVVREGDPARARVAVREEEGGVAVCVLFPEDSPDDCHLGGMKRAPRRDGAREARVDLVARVPRGVRLIASTVDGPILARGLTGDVQAKTVNGDVTVSTGGAADAVTVNGSIDATLTTPPHAPLSFTTTNGAVSVTFAAGTDADVDAATVQGSVTATFPIDVRSAAPGGFGPKSGHAKLGRGGTQVRVQTVNGDVALRVH